MRKAVNHLKKSDPILRAIIERVGPCRMEFSPAEFSSVAEAIVYQQLNGKAANVPLASGETVIVLVIPVPVILPGVQVAV